MLDWLTSDRVKSIKLVATVVVAAATAVTALFGALKPPDTTATAKAYELLRSEVVAQRAELLEVHEGLAELDGWFKAWREDQKSHAVETIPTVTVRPRFSRAVPSSQPAGRDAVTANVDAEKTLPPPPQMPAAPKPRSALPETRELF